MNKIKLLLPVVAGLLLTAQAFAQHGQVSARINAGVNFLDTSVSSGHNATITKNNIDTGFLVGGAIDYKIMPQVRVGISYDYLANDLDIKLPLNQSVSLDYSQSVFLANAYYDFSHLIKDITPYIGVGLGYNHLTPSTQVAGNTVTDASGGFAWRVAVGANYNLTHEFEIGLGYSYTGASISENNGTVNVTNNSILASLGYNF
jgi:opacity protein-like surface antigen